MQERPKIFAKEFPATIENNEFAESRAEMLERAGATGYFPQIYLLALKTGQKHEKSYIFMERIEGFTLAESPPEFDGYKFSVGFAKDLARAFLGFYEAGFVQEDNHPFNVMFDTNNNRIVFVDGEGVAEVTKEWHSMRRLVKFFSETLISAYLRNLYWSIVDETAIEEFENEESRGLALVVLNRAGLLGKIDPQIREFIIRGINRETCPENFDELFAITEDKASRVI